VNIQYAVLEIDEGSHELVEKLYFDRLKDFVYVALMRGCDIDKPRNLAKSVNVE